MMAAFEEVRRKHAAMPPEAFNNDSVYKQNLNEVRDWNELRICAYHLGPIPFQKQFNRIHCETSMLD